MLELEYKGSHGSFIIGLLLGRLIPHIASLSRDLFGYFQIILVYKSTTDYVNKGANLTIDLFLPDWVQWFVSLVKSES